MRVAWRDSLRYDTQSYYEISYDIVSQRISHHVDRSLKRMQRGKALGLVIAELLASANEKCASRFLVRSDLRTDIAEAMLFHIW